MIKIDQPRTITTEAYRALIQGAGFEKIDDLVELRFTAFGIYAKVICRDENGRGFRGSADDFATDTIFVQIKDAEVKG